AVEQHSGQKKMTVESRQNGQVKRHVGQGADIQTAILAISHAVAGQHHGPHGCEPTNLASHGSEPTNLASHGSEPTYLAIHGSEPGFSPPAHLPHWYLSRFLNTWQILPPTSLNLTGSLTRKGFITSKGLHNTIKVSPSFKLTRNPLLRKMHCIHCKTSPATNGHLCTSCIFDIASRLKKDSSSIPVVENLTKMTKQKEALMRAKSQLMSKQSTVSPHQLVSKEIEIVESSSQAPYELAKRKRVSAFTPKQPKKPNAFKPSPAAASKRTVPNTSIPVQCGFHVQVKGRFVSEFSRHPKAQFIESNNPNSHNKLLAELRDKFKGHDLGLYGPFSKTHYPFTHLGTKKSGFDNRKSFMAHLDAHKTNKQIDLILDYDDYAKSCAQDLNTSDLSWDWFGTPELSVILTELNASDWSEGLWHELDPNGTDTVRLLNEKVWILKAQLLDTPNIHPMAAKYSLSRNHLPFPIYRMRSYALACQFMALFCQAVSSAPRAASDLKNHSQALRRRYEPVSSASYLFKSLLISKSGKIDQNPWETNYHGKPFWQIFF
ncbi:hypothetical protein MJO29_016507, partial [Puccinia striiformis f. sp. tritici]